MCSFLCTSATWGKQSGLRKDKHQAVLNLSGSFGGSYHLKLSGFSLWFQYKKNIGNHGVVSEQWIHSYGKCFVLISYLSTSLPHVYIFIFLPVVGDRELLQLQELGHHWILRMGYLMRSIWKCSHTSNGSHILLTWWAAYGAWKPKYSGSNL